jgi:hypothetical protein
MMNHGFEHVARARIDERLREAEQARLARSVQAEPTPRRSWRERSPLALVRRLTRVAASW